MAQGSFDLTAALLNTSSVDKSVREQAEASLHAFQESNWQGYVSGLAQELSNESKGEQSRQVSGLLLKNLLDAKDARLKEEKYAKWEGVDGTLKAQIREALVRTLSSPVAPAQQSAAMVIAKVSHIELLKGNWPDLLQSLHTLMADGTESVRAHALTCLGYVCEEHKYESTLFPQQDTNKILTSLVQGMSSTQPADVRLAATRALCDAVEFAAMNFEKQAERDYLMQMICEAAICPDVRVRLAAYQCLVKVADIHYKYLEPYIQALYQLTTQSFKDADSEVAMQAVEFWSTVADVEIELQELEDREGVDSSDSDCKHYLDKACPLLLPLLLELLTQQAEDQDEDANEWNVCMSAGVCVAAIARAVEDTVMPIASEYIKTNVSKSSGPEDWRWREAAMTVFGSIVDGPRRATLLPFVQEAFHFLITQGLQDAHPMVKRTTAWTIGRIFEFLHDSTLNPPLVTPANAPTLVEALLAALVDGPAMAERACYAIQQLACGFVNDDEAHELTPYFTKLAEALMTVAYADVASQDTSHNLHISAFEAINDVIYYSASTSMQYVCEMVPHLITRLQETFGHAALQDEHLIQRKHELQGQLCAALQVTIRRMDIHPDGKTVLLQRADAIMEVLLQVQASRTSVSEEVMLAMSALCLAQGPGFAKYMQYVMPHLMAGLTRHEEFQVCRVCVNALGDIAREIKHELMPYANQIMSQLLTNLQSQELHRDVKPDILAVFGDIAQGLEANFDPYLSPVLETLQAAMNIAYNNQQTYQTDSDPDDTLITYNNDLRLGIITAAAGILSSVADDPAQIPPATAQLLHPFGKHILTFLSLVHQDYDYADDTVRKEAAALLGDVCRVPGIKPEFMNATTQAWIQEFLTQSVEVSPTTTEYAKQQIAAITSA